MLKNNLPTIISGTLVALCGIIASTFPEYAPIASALGALISAAATKIAHGMVPPSKDAS